MFILYRLFLNMSSSKHNNNLFVFVTFNSDKEKSRLYIFMYLHTIRKTAESCISAQHLINTK